jgi:hypothetical protein
MGNLEYSPFGQEAGYGSAEFRDSRSLASSKKAPHLLPITHDQQLNYVVTFGERYFLVRTNFNLL